MNQSDSTASIRPLVDLLSVVLMIILVTACSAEPDSRHTRTPLVPTTKTVADKLNLTSTVNTTQRDSAQDSQVEKLNIPTVNPTLAAVPDFAAMLPEPDIKSPPDRDFHDLATRLVPGYTKQQGTDISKPLEVGQQVEFWVSRDEGSAMVVGNVAHISNHAYWIFENGYAPNPQDIELVAENFETIVWPSVTGVFGLPISPGIDGDVRVVIFNAVIRTGVGGYFSAADSYPKEINPFSNQREAVYMSANRINLNGPDYMSTIAHELQHATHFAADPSEDTWVNEGLSEVAAELAGFTRTAKSAFMNAPSTSLIEWPPDTQHSVANYGAANLFFEFLASNYGGYELLGALVQNKEDGLISIDTTIAQHGFDIGADEIFADWLVANHLRADEGRYSYKTLPATKVKHVYKRSPYTVSNEVKAFGADYYVASAGSDQVDIVFRGQPETSLIGIPPHSGKTCWWSNHGDSIDSKLTRAIDLTSVNSATLNYWTFYDIEEFWDYAYIMVSTDAGSTWDILSSNLTTDINPYGNAYGEGLTGTSVNWVQDSIDLSEYAGQKLLLRIEYITDDAVFSKGACFDDFEIPEIGWFDNTSGVDDWISEGFALVEESVPTQYLIQVIHQKNAGEQVVHRIPIDASAVGSITIEEVDNDDLIVAIISAVNRHSTIPTEYTLSVSH